jgi:hypothetical protein
MAELGPVPPPSRSRTASTKLRSEADCGHPVSGGAAVSPAGDAGAFALDWELPRRMVDAR